MISKYFTLSSISKSEWNSEIRGFDNILLERNYWKILFFAKVSEYFEILVNMSQVLSILFSLLMYNTFPVVYCAIGT